MEPVASITLPPGRETWLKTGEDRSFLMLRGVKRPLKAGELVPITLDVKTGRGTTRVPVKAAVVVPAGYSGKLEIDEH